MVTIERDQAADIYAAISTKMQKTDDQFTYIGIILVDLELQNLSYSNRIIFQYCQISAPDRQYIKKYLRKISKIVQHSLSGGFITDIIV